MSQVWYQLAALPVASGILKPLSPFSVRGKYCWTMVFSACITQARWISLGARYLELLYRFPRFLGRECIHPFLIHSRLSRSILCPLPVCRTLMPPMSSFMLGIIPWYEFTQCSLARWHRLWHKYSCMRTYLPRYQVSVLVCSTYLISESGIHLTVTWQVFGVRWFLRSQIHMLQLCSYETNALGYSAFCGLFSQEDFLNYEYYFDLVCS